ncbi:MAG: N-acetylmuramoyl-L-alanine amidase family protein [Lachnospiraceae bacterium]
MRFINNVIKDKRFKTGKIMLLCMIVFVLTAGMPIKSQAAEADILARIEALKVKFPDGKYWNHVGSTQENGNGWTETPCACHNTGVCIDALSTCTCNHYYDSVQASHNQSTQCMGFANKLGYDVFGATTWTTYTSPTAEQIAAIRVGDIVRFTNHSVFVIARNGNIITVGENNYSGKCRISWGREIDLTTNAIEYFEHADNYDTIVGGSLTEAGTGGLSPTETPDTETTDTEDPTTEEASTEAPASYTGWQKAADGTHYQYVKNGKILKSQWLTLNKKKYYLDKNGYRATGLYKISGKTYYFNTKGVCQKKKWVTVDGEDYYIGSGGYALKSQWLYKGNVLVYVTGDGSVAKNELVKINGSTYYFNAKGKRSKGFKKCNGKYYYCNSWGIILKKQWITVGSKKYYVQASGVRVQSKLLKIGKYRYYFNEKGQLLKNQEITYNGKVYEADKQGRCNFIQYEDVE